MADKDTSTLQSYMDKATGAAQSVIGSLTGNQNDKAQGEARQDEADIKNQASHAGASIGGVSVSSSGVAANDARRQEGSWDQTIGSGKEAVGNMLGMEGMKREGQQQNQEGQVKEAGGQLSDLGGGVADRVKGTVGGIAAGLTGNREEQEKRQMQHDTGKTLQRGAEADIDRQNA